MKKKLGLENLNVKSFQTTHEKLDVKGGNESLYQCTEGNTCPTWTYNQWCWGSDRTYEAFCTAPK